MSNESGNRVTRRCHVVPVFYLKNFCDRQGKLWALDRKSGKIFRTSPENVANIRDFYRGEKAAHEDDLEEKLSLIESDAAPQLRSLLNGATDVGPELARLIAWMMARTGWVSRLVEPYGFKNYLLRNFEELCQADTRGRPLPIGFRGPTGELIECPLNLARRYLEDETWSVVMTQDMLLDAMRMQAWCFQTMHLPRLQWVTVTAPAGNHFITSDRPVSWDVNQSGWHDFPAALKKPEVDVIFPISPSRALMAGHTQASMLQMTVTPRYLNDLIAMRSDRFLFASVRADLESVIPEPIN